MLDPNPKAGTPIACLTPSLKDCDENKFKDYPPRNNLPTSGLFSNSSPFPTIANSPETKT